jgi:hypothetical protein
MKCVTLLVVEGAAFVRHCWKFISKDAPNYYWERKCQGAVAELKLHFKAVTSDTDLL